MGGGGEGEGQGREGVYRNDCVGPSVPLVGKKPCCIRKISPETLSGFQ